MHRVYGLQFTVLSTSKALDIQQQQKVLQITKYNIYGIALSPGNCSWQPFVVI